MAANKAGEFISRLGDFGAPGQLVVAELRTELGDFLQAKLRELP
jgi:hypothetical protein